MAVVTVWVSSVIERFVPRAFRRHPTDAAGLDAVVVADGAHPRWNVVTGEQRPAVFTRHYLIHRSWLIRSRVLAHNCCLPAGVGRPPTGSTGAIAA